MVLNRYDVVVIGLGVHGCAAARALAARGVRVLAVDAHGPTHRYGSSHGESRIFRRAYWEGAAYLPLLERADALWSELEDGHGDVLARRTGALFIGSERDGLVEGCRRTAAAGGIPHEVWDAERAGERYPWLAPAKDTVVLYEPGAYTLLADRARFALADAAVRDGAVLRYGERALDVVGGGAGAVVRLASGETVACGAVVVTAGPWLNDFVGDELPGVLRPQRVAVYWFRTLAPEGNEGWPSFVHESAGGDIVYGCPEWGRGGREVKVGFHNRQRATADPAAPAAGAVSDADAAELAGAAARFLTGLSPEPVRARTCLYTMTPDGSFIVDRLRTMPRVVYAAACSGHGFKFAPAIGACLAQLALDGRTDLDLSAFAATRFTAG
ncbi:N-methyl-L-tryptophan oxidase [Streptomyces sp. NPDC090022]|uniref:N-methyl-L-tryptophan oxidase n=1 Tax=Streptomyces sp. NPDC090022 TaxID=3365920 RepID=UPI00381EE043